MKNWILMAIAALFFCACDSGVLNEKKFTQYYFNELKAALPDVEFKIKDDLEISSFFNGNEYTHFLDNAYYDYTLQPDSIQPIIAGYIRSGKELYKEKEGVDVNKIIPVIKPVSYLEMVKDLGANEDSAKKVSLLSEKYNDELVIVYAEDTESSTAYMTKENFDSLNIKKDTLLRFAVKNLINNVPEIERSGENHLYIITAGGNYEASLILWEEFWQTNIFGVEGDIIVAIPSRDLLFVTGSEHKQQIETLKEYINEAYQQNNYPVSPYLYKWNGKKFEKYL